MQSSSLMCALLHPCQAIMAIPPSSRKPCARADAGSSEPFKMAERKSKLVPEPRAARFSARGSTTN